MSNLRIEEVVERGIQKQTAVEKDQSLKIVPGGTGGTPLNLFDPFTNTAQKTFLWDYAGFGWNQGAWYAKYENVILRLNDSIILQKGTGTVSFSRNNAVTRVNQFGETDTVEIDEAAFDWIVGPNNKNRYCLRCDQTNALLLLPIHRNIPRRAGFISFWIRPQWAGSPSEITDRIIFEAGNWKLWKPSGTTLLRWQVPELDGTLKQADYNISAWAINSWHFVIAEWDRVNNRIRLWTEDTLRTTTVSNDRYDELPDNAGIGQGSVAGLPANAYIIDFRVWPVIPTQTIIDTLFAIKA